MRNADLKSSLVIVLMIISFSSKAQFPSLIVSTVTGTADKIGMDGSAHPLLQHQQIFENEKIVLGKHADVLLFDYNNHYYEVTKAGQYSCAQIRALVSARQVGLPAVFFDFIKEEFYKPDARPMGIKGNNIGGAVAASSRGMCDLRLTPRSGVKTTDDSIVFKWSAASEKCLYEVTILDDHRNELFTVGTRDTTITLFKRDFLIKPGSRRLYWLVKSKSSSCRETELPAAFSFYSAGPAAQEIAADIAKLPQENDPFLYNLKIASSLADDGWPATAELYLLKAKTLLK